MKTFVTGKHPGTTKMPSGHEVETVSEEEYRNALKAASSALKPRHPATSIAE